MCRSPDLERNMKSYSLVPFIRVHSMPVLGQGRLPKQSHKDGNTSSLQQNSGINAHTMDTQAPSEDHQILWEPNLDVREPNLALHGFSRNIRPSPGHTSLLTRLDLRLPPILYPYLTRIRKLMSNPQPISSALERDHGNVHPGGK